DAGEHPDVSHVRLERLQRFQQDVDVEGADLKPLDLLPSECDRGVPALRVVIPEVGQPEQTHDVGRSLDRGPRRGRQDQDLVAPGAEGVHRLSATEFVAADDVRRVQVADDEDLHAASSDSDDRPINESYTATSFAPATR